LVSYHPLPVLSERLSQSTAEDDVAGAAPVGLPVTEVDVTAVPPVGLPGAAVPEQLATRLTIMTRDSHAMGLARRGLANAISISPASS